MIASDSRVSAEPGDPNNQMPSMISSRHIVSTANGPGSYYSPNSVVYLYVPTTQATASVTMAYRLGSIYSMGIFLAPNCTLPNPAGSYVQYNPAVGSTASISNSQATAQLVSGTTTYRVYCVVVTTTSTGNNFFELITSIPGALMGAYPGGGASLGTGYAHESAPAGYNSSISFNQLVSFSAPCGIANTNPPIQLYDLDMYNTSFGTSMNPNMRVRLKRANKDGTNPVYLSLTGSFQAGGNATTGYVPALNSTLGDNNGDNVIDSTFGGTNQRPLWNVQIAGANYDSAYKYILEVNGVRNTNLIRIKLPYDQIYSGVICPPTNQTPTATVSASCTNGTVLIRLTGVTDPDGGNVTAIADVNIAVATPANQSWTGAGNHDFTFAGRPMDGITYTARVTLDDAQTTDIVTYDRTYSCPSPPANPTCAITTTIVGSSLPDVQQNGRLRITITIRNSQTNTTFGSSFSSVDWPATVDTRSLGGPVWTNNTYGTVIPQGTASDSREFTVTVASNTYEIIAYLRNGSNYIPCGGNLTSTPPPPPCVINNTDCCPAGSPFCTVPPIPVSGFPYVRSYGGDVIAGSGFENAGSCSTTPAGAINAWIDYKTTPPAGIIGSGTQMANFALEKIRGFRSDTQNDNSRPQIRAFSNTETINTSGITYGASLSAREELGGNYVGSLCASEWQTPTTGAAPLGGAVDVAGVQGVFTRTGDLNVTASGAISGKKTIYVSGNVFINGSSLVYTSGWANVAAVPYMVIVATGNIYIHPTVTNLDGFIISKNNIFTCYDPSNINAAITAPVGGGHPCINTRLTVNGALLARKVNLWRLGGSVGLSTVDERYSTSSTRAGETIRLSPEYFFASQAEQPLNGAGGNADRTYDAIISLPPTF
ncbi:MAG: hypothetical protein M3Q70_00280 [bacterium]|nr:hypothetical protein [bacterium]